MYLLAKFGDHRCHRNGDINSYINSNIYTLENAQLTATIRHIARFLKSGIPIYNTVVQDTAGKKKQQEEHRQLQSVLRFTQTQ